MPPFDGLPDCPSCHGSGILYDWVPYGMGNVRIPIDCYCITEQAEAWREAQDALRDEFDGLEQQAKDLAAEVHDLRNANAGLRQVITALRNDNARMTAELAALR